MGSRLRTIVGRRRPVNRWEWLLVSGWRWRHCIPLRWWFIVLYKVLLKILAQFLGSAMAHYVYVLMKSHALWWWRALDPRPSLDLGGDNPRLRRRHLIQEAWFLFSFHLSFHYGFQSFEACTTGAVLSKTLPDLRIVERCMKYCWKCAQEQAPSISNKAR